MAIFKNLLGIREIKSPIFYKEFKEENLAFTSKSPPMLFKPLKPLKEDKEFKE